jgi:6-phospho-beta-glucosidase
MPTVAVLGGSGVATPEFVRALAGLPDGGPGFQVALHGRHAEKLAVVGRVSARIGGDRVKVRWTTDIAAALGGADVVLLQVRVGGYRARAFDETFPHEFGLPGDETMGPGGFANSLRTVPVAVALGCEIERHAPRAWVLNLTNPSSVIQLALHRATRLRVIGLCDSPVTMVEGVAAALGVPSAGVRVDYVGMHHFGWIVRVDRDGADVTSDALSKAESLPWLHVGGDFVRAVGAIPHPYSGFVFAPGRMFERQRGKRSRGDELAGLEDDLLGEYAAWLESPSGAVPAGLTRRRAIWYEKIIVPVLRDLAGGGPHQHIVNVQNRGTLPGVPDDCVIEVRGYVSGAGVTPITPVAPPIDVLALVQHNAAYESLLVDAVLEESRAKALRAMSLNLLVRDTGVAERILERIWPHGGVPL